LRQQFSRNDDSEMTMRVGNAPVSWAVYEADRPNPPFARVLDEIAAAGYEGTELGPYGYLPTEPDALRRELTSRRLGLGSSFVPLPLEDAAARPRSVEAALRVGRLLATQGVDEVIIADDEDPARAARAGRIPADGSAGWTDAQWREAVETLHAAARALRDELGLRVVVHHHAGTFLETPAEVDRLLAETDPELVNLLLDTGHATYGGDDAVDVVRRHGRRVRYVHLKDVRTDQLAEVRRSEVPMAAAWARGVFCPLGDGLVDFPRVVEALRSGGYSGWLIVEQDVVPDANGRLHPEPAQSARQSRKYLRERVGL
jgi:inosose dehydratase